MGPAGESLAADEETVRLLSEHHAKKGSSVNAARMRMATLPTNSEVSHRRGPIMQKSRNFMSDKAETWVTLISECFGNLCLPHRNMRCSLDPVSMGQPASKTFTMLAPHEGDVWCLVFGEAEDS